MEKIEYMNEFRDLRTKDVCEFLSNNKDEQLELWLNHYIKLLEIIPEYVDCCDKIQLQVKNIISKK